MFDGIVRKLQDVRYISQLKKNFISVRALEAQGLRGTLGEGIHKTFNSSLVTLKGIRCNNLYYWKGVVTENLMASERLGDNAIRLWQMRFGRDGMDSLQTLTK